MNEKSGRGDDLFDLVAFFITSARGSIEEGPNTASLRMVDAIPRILSLFPQVVESDPFLKNVRIFIDDNKSKQYHDSLENYVRFLDSLLEKLAVEIRKRNNLPSAVKGRRRRSKTRQIRKRRKETP